MARFSSRLIIACILIAFGVFFGVEIAKNGIEQINGPLEQQAVVYEVEEIQGEAEPVVEDEVEQHAPEQLQPLRPIPADKPIHKLAGKTEQVLESSLQSGVELIVSLFEIIVY